MQYLQKILPLILASFTIPSLAHAESIGQSQSQIVSHPQSRYLVLASNSNSQRILITQSLLSQFIARFSLLYEEGDLKNFMELFAADAETNDASDKIAIQKNYASLFSATEMRVIDLQGLKWQISQNSAEGKGDFLVTVLHQGGKEMKSFSGKLVLELRQNNGHLELTKFFHAYGEDDN